MAHGSDDFYQLRVVEKSYNTRMYIVCSACFRYPRDKQKRGYRGFRVAFAKKSPTEYVILNYSMRSHIAGAHMLN